MIHQESIDEVLSTAQVEDVIADYVQLKRSGSNFKGLCPFHNEKTPSFMVSPDKQIYKCFGCGKSGDSVRFLMDLEDLNFVEAIRNLAQKYNIKLKESSSPEQDRIFELRDSLHARNEVAMQYYEQQLWETDYGRAVGIGYFKERGFLESTIKKFRLGMTPEVKNDLAKTLLERGHAKEDLASIGLLNQYGGDFFRDRVIFPIQSVSGKVLGFAGRILESDKDAPKYINTKETEIYNKRKVLYGLFQARQEIKKQKSCILVEGYTDVMSLHQYGVKNVVAASGTSLTAEQCKLLRRYTQKIVLLFDGDGAGVKAALRGLDIVLDEGLFPDIVVLPDGEDPDSFMREVGMEKFEEYIRENSKDFIFFKSDFLLKESANNPIDRANAYKDVSKSLAFISDPITRSLYVQECANLFGIEEAILLDEVKKHLKKNAQKRVTNLQKQVDQKRTVGPRKLSDKNKAKDDSNQERGILRSILLYGDQLLESGITLSAFIQANFESELDRFDDELVVDILREHFSGLDEGEHRGLEYFVAHGNTLVSQLCIDLIASPHSYSPNWENIMDNTLLNQPPPEKNYEAESLEQVLRVKMRKINKMILDQQQKLKNGGLSAEEQEVQLNVLLRLAQARNKIANEVGQVVVT